ncbi:unnamed protein product [Prunus armeniaca]|uniref:Uncharacterized protein n=1 Tax=Prunus armeniaca TaxID=36596 RepID=A0A6J5XC18_PRUAR|nr:unnamed protein product [Prunus armeniaca]
MHNKTAKPLSSGIRVHWQNSQPSAAAADLISGKGHVLTMTSRQYDPKGKLPEMEKSPVNISEMEKTQKFESQTSILELLRRLSGSNDIPVQPCSPSLTMPSAAADLTPAEYRALTKLSEVLSAQLSARLSAQLSAQQLQLADTQKSILEELRLIRSSNASLSQSTTTPNFTVIDDSPNREPFNPHPSPEHASITTHQGEDRSVYLLVSFDDIKYTNSIYKVTFKHGGVTHEPPVVGLVAEYYDGFRIKGARIFNPSKLYIIPEEVYNKTRGAKSCRPLGYSIDTKTGSYCSSLPPSIASKRTGTLVSAYDKLYYVALPGSSPSIKEPSFERYDPDQDVWERMTSFPFYRDCGSHTKIIGYAVCYGVILFSLSDSSMNPYVVAFHESRNQWNRVTSASYASFRGRAVVVGNTIYALHALIEEVIITFSLRMDKGEDGGIAYSLNPLFVLRGLKIACPPVRFNELKTGYLVHLGNKDFFHVKTGSPDEEALPVVQYLCITTFQITVGGGKPIIRTIYSTVHPMDIKGREWFSLEFCFTPEFGDYEPIEVETVTSMNQPKQEETTLDEHDKEFLIRKGTRSKLRACPWLSGKLEV